MMRYLITGATGAIGSALVEHLAGEGTRCCGRSGELLWKPLHRRRDEAVTVRRFAELIYRAAGTEGRVRGMPVWMLRLLGLVNAEARAGAQVMHTFAQDLSMDGAAIRRDAGFVPQVDYEEGIHWTLDWVRRQEELKQ